MTIFYTAPTAICAWMAMGNEAVHGSQRTSLRLLGSVGEPINLEAWEWYYHVVGEGCAPIVDVCWHGHLTCPKPVPVK